MRRVREGSALKPKPWKWLKVRFLDSEEYARWADEGEIEPEVRIGKEVPAEDLVPLRTRQKSTGHATSTKRATHFGMYKPSEAIRQRASKVGKRTRGLRGATF